MLRSLSLALLLLTPIVDAASCLTTAFVLNLYPSWKYRAQVVFSGHRFAALSYGDHAIALFRVDMNDSVQVALVNKNGGRARHPRRARARARFTLSTLFSFSSCYRRSRRSKRHEQIPKASTGEMSKRSHCRSHGIGRRNRLFVPRRRRRFDPKSKQLLLYSL